MPVYMIRAGADGPVKIGYGANPARRIEELQTAHPERLTVLRVMDGDLRFESALHRHFADLRVRGEWFIHSDAMLGDLEFLRATAANSDVVTGIQQVIDAAGGTKALAAHLGIKAPSIYSWKRVPAERARAVSKITGIPLHVLRPDVWPAPLAVAA
jgi:hypothetical protein